MIISEDGTIVTNAHVVDDANLDNSRANQRDDLRRHSARRGHFGNIAILVIDASGLAAIELGSTTALAVGDPVIAIGNPLALEGGPSVSTGIVSALDRTFEDSDTT